MIKGMIYLRKREIKMQLMDLKQQGIDIQENIPLSRFTFTKTGGPAQYLAFPKNLKELELLVNTVKSNDIPLTVIGNASNLIIRDGGITGLVLMKSRQTKKMQLLLQMRVLELLIHLRQPVKQVLVA